MKLYVLKNEDEEIVGIFSSEDKIKEFYNKIKKDYQTFEQRESEFLDKLSQFADDTPSVFKDGQRHSFDTLYVAIACKDNKEVNYYNEYVNIEKIPEWLYEAYNQMISDNVQEIDSYLWDDIQVLELDKAQEEN